MILKFIKRSDLLKVIVFIFVSLLSFSECSDKKPTEPVVEEEYYFVSDMITIGEITKEYSEDISSSGGTLTVSNPQSSINGLTISIPQNGYQETRNFSVSTAKISNHKLGKNFNPISPLIIIQNGGGYSRTPMKIKIPIKKQDGEFAIGLLYNEITGEIEVLPTVALDESSITVETRHFALSSVTSEFKLGKVNESDALGNMVISSIDETELTGQSIISSGFNPGFDDWEFINYGSYVVPGGHCAGQSLTAMWYYYEKRLKGESPLFHLFDEINNINKPNLLWQDNPLGYRFASTIQTDFDWGDWIGKVYAQTLNPKMVYFTFISALLTTGEPQFVIIRNSTTGLAHAMIVYKVDVTDGILYVADPNYPGNRSISGNVNVRKILYSNDKFDTYGSKSKADGPTIGFDQIAFFGKTANIEWSQITKRYQELKSETIGDDIFPSYNLTVKTSEGEVPLMDKMTVTEEKLEFYCRNTNIPESLPQTDGLQEINVYETSGDFFNQTVSNGIIKLKLSEGENKFGVYVGGYKNDKSDNYYDFQWFTVNYEPEDSSDNPDNPNNTCPGIPTVTYAGTTYNTVQIGDQCWLKENLNVGAMITTTPDQEKDQENNGIIEKYCYENDSTNCNNFGGLYQWDEAMQFKTSGGLQGICPEGWHIPTLSDFEKLKAAVSNDGNALKAIGEGYDDGAGTDTTGFSALLAGYVASDVFSYAGEFASFWTSTELGSFDKVNTMYLNYYDNEINLVNNAKGHAFSVRCVKD